jgi:hypothetical protein
MALQQLIPRDYSEANSQAQRIQWTINRAVGHAFVRCIGPMSLRPSDVSGPLQDRGTGLELRIEPLVAVTDFRDDPGRHLAAKLRGWAKLLNHAAASLE